ncbi:MAG: DUF3109 family protein [Candidatus Riflebacteria bacterium]|nr:DUF3109 family protein [Candidatus Riflebacteria bacterium]
MRLVGNVLISDQVWQTRFACDLQQCRGKCCQYGDLGAPISEEEEQNIVNLLDQVKPRLPRQQQIFLDAGISEKWKGSLHIREIAENTPCPLSFCNDNGVILCSLHDLAIEKHLPLLDVKPLWCSLFPIIITQSDNDWLINCHLPDFCRSITNPPPLLLSFADLLQTFFGKEWIEQVKHEYELDTGMEIIS